ncbi:MAG: hypothetical protein AABP62_02565 [Planctomycetota bacterium]
MPQQADGHLARQRPEPQFAGTDEAVIPQRPEFLKRRIPRDQQPHSASVLNGRPQQPHPLDELLLRLRFLPDDFFEPFELTQTQEYAIPSGPLFECFEPIPARLPATSPAIVAATPAPAAELVPAAAFPEPETSRMSPSSLRVKTAVREFGSVWQAAFHC